MRRIAATLGFVSAAALAQVPGFNTTFTVHVADPDNRPVADAFVMAREFVNVPQFHGSRTYCERADIGVATEQAHRVELPVAGMSHLSPSRAFGLEAFGYAPGICIEHTASARAAAISASMPSMGQRPEQPPVKPSSEIWLRAKPVPGNEERLQYLKGLAEALACNAWSTRSGLAMPKLAAAMNAEASAIARTRYEKLIASRVRDALASAASLAPNPDDFQRPTGIATAQPAFARDFIIAPANVAVRFPGANDANQMIVVARRGSAQAIAVSPASPGGAAFATTSPASPKPEQTRLVIHCRHGEPSACDLDERDERGETALSSYVARLDPEGARLLLEAGANPSVATNLFGGDAIDALIQRIYSRPPVAGSPEAANAAAMMDLLAASPKASIRAGLRAQLATDPSTWDLVNSADARALLVRAREKFALLPSRPDPVRACEPLESGRANEPMPVRLRIR